MKTGINPMQQTLHRPHTAPAPAAGTSEHLPFVPRRIAINFLPHFDWTIEVGTPWPAVQPRSHPLAPAHTADCIALGFAPLELVIDKANKKKVRRQREHPVPLWTGSVRNETSH